jgi:alpha-L-fucosidase 2
LERWHRLRQRGLDRHATGSMKGLRARGGFEVDVAWKDGKLSEATITSLNGGSATLRLGDKIHPVKLAKGETFRWSGN